MANFDHQQKLELRRLVKGLLRNSSTSGGGGGGTSVALKNTDELAEGKNNLYYTDERVDDRIDSLLTEGTNITFTYNDSAGTLTIDSVVAVQDEGSGLGDFDTLNFVGAGVAATDGGSGVATITISGGGGAGGDAWSDPIDSSITVDTDSMYDIGTSGARLATVYLDDLVVTNNVDGRDVSADGQDLDDLVTLTGLAANSTDLGTFTGSTISDSNDIQGALQELETAVEAVTGAWTLTTSSTVSAGASADVAIPSADKVKIEIVGTPATDGTALWFRVSTDSGSSFKSGASDYEWGESIILPSSFARDSGDTADSEIQLTELSTVGNTSGEFFEFELIITGANSTSRFTTIRVDGIWYDPSADLVRVMGAGFYTATTVVDAVQFLMSSGNINAEVHVYEWV